VRQQAEHKSYTFSRQDVLKGKLPPEVKDQIHQMRKDGEPASEISRKLNIEPRSLRKYLSQHDREIFGNDSLKIGINSVSEEILRKMIEARKNGETIVEIAKINNVEAYSLGKLFREQGIVSELKDTMIHVGKKQFSQEKMNTVCEQRKNGASLRDLAKELGINEKTLGGYFYRNDVHPNDISFREINRKYEIDHDFFKKVDTSEKAYLFGLIMTDGNLHKKHNSLRFDFQGRDRELCEIARRYLGSDVPIHERSDKKGRPQVYVQFNSKTLITDLENLGIQRGLKEYQNTFPDETKVPKQFHPDLIRGIIDGDGSVIISHRTSNNSSYLAYSVSISGTREMLQGLQRALISGVNLNETKIAPDKRAVNNFTLQYSGSGNVAKIYEFIYPPGFEPEGNCLQRKHDRMKEAWEKHHFKD
jgi:hypothetical protein